MTGSEQEEKQNMSRQAVHIQCLSVVSIIYIKRCMKYEGIIDQHCTCFNPCEHDRIRTGEKSLQGVPHVKICFVLWMRKCICPCFRHPLCVTHTLPLNKPSLAQEAGQAWQGLYRHPLFHPQHSGSPSTRICNRLKQLERQTFEGLSVSLPLTNVL